MNSSKVVNAQTHDVKDHLNRCYDLYSSRVVKIERDYIESTYRRRRMNVSCQCNIRRDLMCTCRRLASPEPIYFASPKQVYRYSDWRSYTDIGVGSIKKLPRKRIRRIYLPETIDKAVGNVDVTSCINRRRRQQGAGGYYENKRTSSKCVGGFVDNDNISLLSKKLSPIIQNKSGTTSPRSEILKEQNVNKGTYGLQKQKTSFNVQVNMNDINATAEPKEALSSKTKNSQTSKHTMQGEVTRDVLPKVSDNLKSVVINDTNETCKNYSSDSLVQHVHNLEIPSDNKQSKMSVDPMENKLEREYRKIFTTKSKERTSVDKPMPDLKSASLLRRRFEALRRGLGKKESKKESILINKISSQVSMASRKDVAIASDPPSLEGRSYSSTKVYNPFQSTTNEYKAHPKISSNKSPKNKRIKDSLQWSLELGDSKCESVQGMFKLWGKKFNLDEGNSKTSPTISNDVTNNPEGVSKSESPPQVEMQKKKQGRKFFIFGKKTKDKETKQNNYKPKKGVTAGRCEVKDGLTIKVGGGNEYTVKESVKKQEKHLDKYGDILCKGWLDKYITNTRDSRNSVHIRWNNKMYATSSSTILELMDSVYKYTGIDFRSRSEVTTGESSTFRSYTKQRVHFMQQDIDAWMIPKMITNQQNKQIIEDRVYHNRNKCQRLFVDASKGFSQKIELVLHSKPNSKSSEYVIINIPEGYFSQSSSELRAQSSDEKIYKIVEYDTSELKKIKENRHMDTGDTFTKDIVSARNDQEDMIPEVPASVIKKPSLLRDVAIQGSDVFVPKRCDVIGVGIITQRDIRDVRKPILKVEDELSDYESEENPSIRQPNCELAESYLQDYCRNLMPSGVDLFSWRLSDPQLQSSERNSVASLSQGDGTKSYPSMYDNFQESTIVLSSCETSSCSHCIAFEDEKKPDDSLKTKFLSKFKKKSSEAPMTSDKRNCPKDSIEVHKRRQYYACSNQKSKWFVDETETHSSPNVECKAKTPDCPKLNKPCWRIHDDSKNKKRGKEKHVSLPGCQDMGRLVDKLSDRTLEGILSHKGFENYKKCPRSPKHTEVSPSPICVIPQPPCKESCKEQKNPPCTKKNAPSCDELLQPPVNLKVPTPPCISSPRSPPTPPLCVKPVKKPPCSACNNLRRMSNENLQQQKGLSPKKCSLQSLISLKKSPRPSPKTSDACFPTKSNESKRKKECKPCKKNFNTPPTPPPTAYHMPQTPTDCRNDSKEKITGLHLKKNPSKKTNSANECSDNCSGVIRLNSQEKITVRMKKCTPSTEEIREGLNIKVQDEDGQTLYERIDYKQSSDVNKCILLQDVFKDPQIHRVSTPPLQDNTTQIKSQNEMCEDKSDTSIDNLVEINFTLKLKQGDKGTEVDIKNTGDAEIKQNREGQTMESQKDIYIIQNQNQAEPDSLTTGNKNDVNIKIIIKNYKTESEKCNENETYAVHNADNDVFTKRISGKFQTVSTGYSDTDQLAFSIQRASVGLTTSEDRSGVQSKLSECVPSTPSVNVPMKLITSSQSITKRSVTEQTVHSTTCVNEEEKSTEGRNKSSTNNAWNSTVISYEETDRFNDDKSDKYLPLESKNHTVDETSDESVLYKKIGLRTRAEKKEMFKKLLRTSSAVKKPENKKRIKKIIHAILTSDSSGIEIAVSNNKLAKELTYDSIDPGYFRDTDSIFNYYRDSAMSNYEESKNEKINPTRNDSELSENESVASFVDKKQACLCSTLATKLNITLNGAPNNSGCCCCGGTVKKDEEINCKLGAVELFNLKTCVDVETQDSKHVSNKINSTNLSIRSNTQSVVIKKTSVTIQKSINKYDHPAAKYKCPQIFRPDSSDIHYGMKWLNRERVLGLSDDEIIIVNSNTVQQSIRNRKSKANNVSRHNSKHVAADILQLNETKKAVLEIYAEKIVSGEGEKIVAKLPKFHMEKENDISNYEDIVTGRKKVSKRNFVMMTINR